MCGIVKDYHCMLSTATLMPNNKTAIYTVVYAGHCCCEITLSRHCVEK